MPAPPSPAVNKTSLVLTLTHEFQPSLELFVRLAKLDALAALLRPAYNRCWTPTVTMWGMILAYLGPKKATLEQVLATLRLGAADLLCAPGKELSRLLATCTSTSAYSQARERLPLPWLRRCLAAQAEALSGLATGWHWRALRVLVLDGTQIPLRSRGRIPAVFPPASNQYGPAYWCQARVLGCFCRGTGLAVAAVFGAITDGEQAQAVRLILYGLSHLPRASVLWLGDRNFGVWRVVAAAWQRQSQVLVRLTAARAAKLAGGQRLLAGLDLPVSWSPSRHDVRDRGLTAVTVPGRLLVVACARPAFRPQLLYLFTTLTDPVVYPAADLAALSARRWQVEINFRQLKPQLGRDRLEVQSPGMAKREIYAGLRAYNLVRGVLLLSAAHRGLPLERLSFATARAELAAGLPRLGREPARTVAWLGGVVHRVGRRPLPRRRSPRPAEPRRKRHRREAFPGLLGSRASARHELEQAWLAGGGTKSQWHWAGRPLTAFSGRRR